MLNARQLCNAAYALMCEGKSEREREQIDGELNRKPGAGPVSYGTQALMRLIGMPPPPVKPAGPTPLEGGDPA